MGWLDRHWFGFLAAKKLGMSLESIRRPLKPTEVING